MKHVTVFEQYTGAFPIIVRQTSKLRFTVRYGEDVQRNLLPANAAKALGEALLHCAACDGKLVQ